MKCFTPILKQIVGVGFFKGRCLSTAKQAAIVTTAIYIAKSEISECYLYIYWTRFGLWGHHQQWLFLTSRNFLVQLFGKGFKGRCLSTAKQAVIVTTAIYIAKSEISECYLYIYWTCFGLWGHHQQWLFLTSRNFLCGKELLTTSIVLVG